MDEEEETLYFDILMNVRNTLRDRIRFLSTYPAYPTIATDELQNILSIIEASGHYGDYNKDEQE